MSPKPTKTRSSKVHTVLVTSSWVQDHRKPVADHLKRVPSFFCQHPPSALQHVLQSTVLELCKGGGVQSLPCCSSLSEEMVISRLKELRPHALTPHRIVVAPPMDHVVR